MLTYGYPAWINTAKTNIKKLQTLQNKTLRRITNTNRRTSTRVLQNVTGLESISKALEKIKKNFVGKMALHDNIYMQDILQERNLKTNKVATLCSKLT